MSQIEETLHLTDVEMNRYLRSKLRELRPSEQLSVPEMEPEKVPDKLGKKIAWGPVLKIEEKEIVPGPV